jgi:hypothetical protein
MAVGITNATGASIDEASVLYDGEQWRNGGNANAQTMVLEWGIGTSFDMVTTWTAPGAAFNFTSLVNSATASQLDGNDPANRTADLGGNLAGLGWDPGETLWFRWIENNDTGNDHGLSLDNFRFMSIAPVPEPSTMGLTLAGTVGFLALRRRRASRAA